MANRENTVIEITPEVLLKAYACGIFPMAESADDPALHWIEPEMRGIVPLDGFHVASRLARTVRTTPFTVWVDRDFDATVDGCAEAKEDRAKTWINGRIRKIYRSLFDHGHAHSVEVYDGESLVGGLYGVSLGRAYAYGLGAAGEAGVTRALDLLKAEIVASLTLMGIGSIGELRSIGPDALRPNAPLPASRSRSNASAIAL